MTPDGAIYVGVIGSLPAASAVPAYATAYITFTTGGLTMNPVRLVAKPNRAGTQAWQIDGRQVLYSEGGIDSAPVRTVTAAAASGTIGAAMGTIPGGLFVTQGMHLGIRAMFSRGATAAGTVTLSVGIAGTAAFSVSGVAAANTRVALIEGDIWAVGAASQSMTGTLTALQSAAIGASTATTVDFASDVAIAGLFSAGTTSDILEVCDFTIWIE
jgi:hypothetical protein